MKKYIILFFILVGMVGCEKPEEGLQPAQSSNADIVRFRIYQNQNLYFDGAINNEDTTIAIVIPVGIDKKTIRPEILISHLAKVTPGTGEQQDFTTPVEYKVVSENGKSMKTYKVTVNY